MKVLKAQVEAKANGFCDVLYLDSVHKRYVEQTSTANIFLVKVHDWGWSTDLFAYQVVYGWGTCEAVSFIGLYKRLIDVILKMNFYIGQNYLHSSTGRDSFAWRYTQKYNWNCSKPRVPGMYSRIFDEWLRIKILQNSNLLVV